MFLMQRFGQSIRSSNMHLLKSGGKIRVPVNTMSSAVEKFEDAKEKLMTLTEDQGNETKLKLYALFKQATKGNVDSKRPGMMDMVGRAKWDAWKTCENMSQDDAKLAYAKLVDELVGSQAPPEPSRPDQKYKYVIVEKDGHLMKITMNRPTKKNALLHECYEDIMSALDEARDDPNVVLVAWTGAGDYFCSGNDLSNFQNIDMDKIPEMAKQAHELLSRYVTKFIDFPKPLVAVVNGPAVGIGVTVLGLCDLVYASDKATFQTPFSNLGQSPEGCSSYIFPRLFGTGKASEILLFNKKITVEEACKGRLVTEIFNHDKLQEQVWPRLKAYSDLPKNSLVFSKQNIRHMYKDKLHEINKLECELLEERWQSDDCKNAIMKFFMGKANL